MNIQPNRAMRRAAARAKPVETERVELLPRYLDKFTVFSDIERIFEKLLHGEIETKQGKPIFTSAKGEICYVVPALEGWIGFWHRVAQKMGLDDKHYAAMDLVRKRLNSATPLQPEQVLAGIDCIARQRALYDKIDRDQLGSIARTHQIALYMEKVQ